MGRGSEYVPRSFVTCITDFDEHECIQALVGSTLAKERIMPSHRTALATARWTSALPSDERN